MDESASERYFDKYIANDNLRTEQGEVTEKKQKEVMEEKSGVLKLAAGGPLLSPLPSAESRTVDKSSPYSSRTLDNNSQNSSAGAEFAQASSSSQPEASAVNPMTLAVPESLEEELPKPTPVICNVFSTVNLGCHLDLDSIARNMWNVEYNPKSFKGLIMRNRDTKATVIMYTSGKMACFVRESRLMARRYARKLQKFGFPVRFLNFKIQNLAATCKAFPVNLKKLCKIWNWEWSGDYGSYLMIVHIMCQPMLFGAK
ncbi:TATA-binding protein 2-like [Archocentrus centrarchus]|uniref:TATA-binding protein 2-like n=1 Tax=Archocentrus centrarchus TaxID=63155 RepID=UPI0011EA1BDB|nr:TATA-binding protein 2-like [Archocentrus centrarchus]